MVVAQEKLAAQIGADILRAGRQRGRRRGRDRLRAGGDLSARRQYRRRRLHGDPSPPSAARISPSTTARPRRPRPRRISSSAPTASPIRRSRATPRSASACPARSPAWRWRWRNSARATSRWRKLIKPAIALARDGFVVADDTADTLSRHVSPDVALAEFRQELLEGGRQPAARRRHAGAERSRRGAVTPSPKKVRADSTKGRSRTRSSARSATPAAS